MCKQDTTSQPFVAVAATSDWRALLIEDYAHEITSLEDQLVSSRQDADSYRALLLAALDGLASLTEKHEIQKARTAALLDELRDLRGFPVRSAA